MESLEKEILAELHTLEQRAKTLFSAGVIGDGRNAEILAKHELGLGNLPKRSVLRDGIAHGRDSIADELSKYIVGDSSVERVAISIENALDDQFATRGQGQWPKNSPITIASKGSDSPLIDTGQLRRSITVETRHAT